MPKGKNQKLKLYYLSRIMTERTDNEHALSMKEIQMRLAEYGVTADRKSIYDDLESLRILGIDIIGEKDGNSYSYHVGKKQFDLSELKLLVDSVQSSKFIPEKKSGDLIKKISGMASNYEAASLKRNVMVQGRIKNMNECVYYGVDEVFAAINKNCQIIFEYMQWNISKQLEKKRKEPYRVSPWALVWVENNYYLVAYDDEEDLIKRFRVDKMKNIMVHEEPRLGRKKFNEFKQANHPAMDFGLFYGEEKEVRIAFKDDKVGQVLDMFGKDIVIRPAKRKGWSETVVYASLNRHFYGMIFTLGKDVSIAGPKSVVDAYRQELEERISGL